MYNSIVKNDHYTCTIEDYVHMHMYTVHVLCTMSRTHLTREGQCNVRQEIRVCLKHVRGVALDILLLEEWAHVRTGSMDTRLQQVAVTLNGHLIHRQNTVSQ